jgi:hypothetical protein
MKLHEIALPATGRTQGSFNQQVEPNVLLSLRNVSQRNGKNPNTFELVAICRLLQTLKDGTFYKQSNPFEVNMSTSKELMDILRAMKPEELCKIADKLNGLLAVKDADAYYNLANPTQEYLMWLQFVQSREANESADDKGTPLSEMKSQKQLFPLLDEFFKTKEYTTKELRAKGVSDETYGKKSMIYVTSKTPAQRKELEAFLKSKGVKIHPDYDPGKATSEIQVSYFKGTRWDV